MELRGYPVYLFTIVRRVKSFSILMGVLTLPKRMPCRYPLGGVQMQMPSSLVKAYRIEIRETADCPWQTLHEKSDNRHRRVVLPVQKNIHAIRWIGLETWGDADVKVFAFDAFAHPFPLTYEPEPGRHWNEVVADIASEDLQEPDHGLEAQSPGKGRVGA